MGSNQNNVFLVTAGYDHTIRFWETLTGISYRTLQHQDSQVNKLKLTPNRKHIAAAATNGFTVRSHWLVATGSANVRLYDCGSLSPSAEVTFSGHTSNVTGLGFCDSYSWMYTGSEDGTIKIWDVRQQGCQREFVQRAMVEAVALHPNQVEIIAADQNGRVRIWDLRAADYVREMIPEPDAALRSIAIAEDGCRYIVSTNTGNVYVYSSEGGSYSSATELTRVKAVAAHKGHQVLCVALSPDGSTLATCASDFSAGVWDTGSWRMKGRLEGHQRWVWDCQWSQDGDYLVTASSDKTAKLWDVSTQECVRTFAGHQKAVVCLALQDVVVDDHTPSSL